MENKFLNKTQTQKYTGTIDFYKEYSKRYWKPL